MLRLGAIFIVLCMVLIAASLGAVLYLLVGLNGPASMIAALAALIGLAIYNAVTARARDREALGAQIADLSRGTSDLARQVAEISRRTAALEGQGDKIVESVAEKAHVLTEPITAELDELGTLVKQLAETVALHELELASAKDFAVAKRNAAPPAAPPPRIRPGRARARSCAGRGSLQRRPRPKGIDRDRAQRGRSQPRRNLSAADRHAAAAQGSLLRGIHPAADRGRHAAATVRVPRTGGDPPA